ncbi:MAG: antitoxin Xre/MbcA/ParS toxin-binding domain-containing protein [Gemmatimonadota bacterium]
MHISAPEVAAVLGGRRALGRKIETVEDLRLAVEEGLPVRSLHIAVRRIASSGKDAAHITHEIVPRTTLHRRKSRLSKPESERLERLARMTALAEEVWEDSELAHEFLMSFQPQLGGKKPLELADSDLGTRQVEELLYKLEYSLPA